MNEHFFNEDKKNERSVLGLLGSGEEVIDRPHSHVVLNERTFSLLGKTLKDVDAQGKEFIVFTKTFAENIGESLCVETHRDDDVGSELGKQITYAVRKGRKGHTRFVHRKYGEPTSCFTVVLKRVTESDENKYLLITAFVGPQAAPEPWDPNATDEDRIFWDIHALLWDPNVVDLSTVTNTCPWK